MCASGPRWVLLLLLLLAARASGATYLEKARTAAQKGDPKKVKDANADHRIATGQSLPGFKQLLFEAHKIHLVHRARDLVSSAETQATSSDIDSVLVGPVPTSRTLTGRGRANAGDSVFMATNLLKELDRHIDELLEGARDALRNERSRFRGPEGDTLELRMTTLLRDPLIRAVFEARGRLRSLLGLKEEHEAQVQQESNEGMDPSRKEGHWILGEVIDALIRANAAIVPSAYTSEDANDQYRRAGDALRTAERAIKGLAEHADPRLHEQVSNLQEDRRIAYYRDLVARAVELGPLPKQAKQKGEKEVATVLQRLHDAYVKLLYRAVWVDVSAGDAEKAVGRVEPGPPKDELQFRIDRLKSDIETYRRDIYIRPHGSQERRR